MNIVIIDPGWRNLGILFVCYDHKQKIIRKFSQAFDLELYEKDTHVSKVILALEEKVFGFFPDGFFDYVVIETQGSQWKKNKRLQEMIETYLVTRNPKTKLFPISAITVKKQFGLEYGKGDHSKHKKDIVEFVKKNQSH